MAYSDWEAVVSGLVLGSGRITLTSNSTIDSLLPTSGGEGYFDLKVVVTSGVPTEGNLIGVHLRYVDEPLPSARYTPRYRGRVMTDNRIGSYHSISKVEMEKDMQVCLQSNEKDEDLVVDVFIRSRG